MAVGAATAATGERKQIYGLVVPGSAREPSGVSSAVKKTRASLLSEARYATETF